MTNLTFTQCKQIIANDDITALRDFVEALNFQPDWIAEPLSIADIQAINQGGCASGAYMPAVTYWQASKTMGEHGDDVLDYLEKQYGELLEPEKGTSWSGLAVHYLSCAVECYCLQFEELLDGVNWD